MSHNQATAECAPASKAGAQLNEQRYWHGLIDEKLAAEFLDLSPRTMQGLRWQGGGPEFIRLSSRCVRYRRVDLRNWAETRLRVSTSDPGPEAAHK